MHKYVYYEVIGQTTGISPALFMAWSLIQLVIFLSPVLLVIYRQGKKDQQFIEAKRDLDGLGIKVADVRSKTDSTINMLETKMNKMDKELGEVRVTLEFIKAAVEELKPRRRS